MQGQLEGQQIGRYLVGQPLGGGGVATVYRAFDQVAGQTVALKVLPPNSDGTTLDRFRREALMAGAMRHPHIVHILQVGTAAGDGAAYIAMDLVEGESLAARLTHVGHLRPADGCALLEPIARALAFAHRNGVIHRDVKPSNILLRAEEIAGTAGNVTRDEYGVAHRVQLETWPTPVIPMLSDFGIARYLDAPELTNVGRTVGTPAFMAPEQCMGSREVDGRADIYALGAVLYRCVLGRLPFNGSTTQILHAHVFEPVMIDEAAMRDMPAAVIEILRRTLAKAPEDRYQDADELATDLGAAEQVGVAGIATTSEATSTIATLPIHMAMPPAKTSGQVLVPAPVFATALPSNSPTPTATRNEPASAPTASMVVAPRVPTTVPTRGRGPTWERVLWAAVFVVIIGGGGLWSAQSWIRVLLQPEGEQQTLPALTFVTFTPTPLAEEPVSGANPTATLTSISVAMPTTIITTVTGPVATATAVVVETATPLSVATPAAIVVQTEMPTAAPPMPTAAIAETPTVDAPPIPAEELVGTCSTVVDAFFLDEVARLTGLLRADFTCPSAPARVTSGQWLPFERGMMVAPDGDPLVYVYYADGSWEQVSRGDGGSADGPPPGEANGQAQLPPPFALVLAENGRQVLLGEPLQAVPTQHAMMVQPFSGGVAVGNQSSGEILFLSRSKLRF